MSESKRRKCLSEEDKVEIIERVKAGDSIEEIAREYDVRGTRIRQIMEQEEANLKSTENLSNIVSKQRGYKLIDEKIVDAAVVIWYQQLRDRGAQITGDMIQEKAIKYCDEYLRSTSFKVSRCWMNKFKKQHSFQKTVLKEGVESMEIGTISQFSEDLKQDIASMNVSLNNVYNADEAGIFWKMFGTFARNMEKENPGENGAEERVTALFCANASGTHQIPLLIIGKDKKPNCLNQFIKEEMSQNRLKYLENFNIFYSHQSKSWMDEEIFTLWYREVFIPRVLEHQETTGTSGRVLLIFDYAPCHPSLDKLNEVHENFKVLYMPSSVPAWIQPMNRGLILTTTRIYKKHLLRRLLLSYKFEGTNDTIKRMDLRDCLILLGVSWDSLKSPFLQKAWKMFLEGAGDSQREPFYVIHSSESLIKINDASTNFPIEIGQKLARILSGPYCGAEKSESILKKWFETDHSDCGWEPMTDLEILYFVQNGACKKEVVNALEEDDDDDVIIEPEEVSALGAFEGLMKFKKWTQGCKNVSMMQSRYIEELEHLVVRLMPKNPQGPLIQVMQSEKDILEILGI